MVKYKNIRFKIIAMLIVFVLSIFFTGFFTAKSVYASTFIDYNTIIDNALIDEYGVSIRGETDFNEILRDKKVLIYFSYNGYTSVIRSLYIIYSSNDIKLTEYGIADKSNYRYLYFENVDGTTIDLYRYYDFNGTLTSMRWGSDKHSLTYKNINNLEGENLIINDIKENFIIYSNHDILIDWEYSLDLLELYPFKTDTLFFSKLPMKGLGKLVQPLPMDQALRQVLSLLPILVSLMVGFLGLRKALVMLRRILYQA